MIKNIEVRFITILDILNPNPYSSNTEYEQNIKVFEKVLFQLIGKLGMIKKRAINHIYLELIRLSKLYAVTRSVEGEMFYRLVRDLICEIDEYNLNR